MMLNGIRKLMTVDALSERVARLEAENARLKKENSSRLLATSFHDVKRPLNLPAGSLRDYVYERVAHDLEGVVEDHLLTVAKTACKTAKPYGGRHALYANV
ncbi:MAG TPA: bZIP transcription factor, partial [Acidimicrobiia bacterium]